MYRSETSPFKAIERKIWIDLWAQFLIITFHNVYRLFNLEFSKWFAKDFAFIGTLKLQDIRSFTDILHLHLLYTENIPSYEYFYLFLSLSFFFLSLFKLLYLQHSYNYFFFFCQLVVIITRCLKTRKSFYDGFLDFQRWKLRNN